MKGSCDERVIVFVCNQNRNAARLKMLSPKLILGLDPNC